MEEMRMAGSKTKDKKKSVADFTTQDGEQSEQVLPVEILDTPLDKNLGDWESTERAKEAFIEFFSTELVTISKACKVLHIGRTTFYEWMNEDPAFKAAFEEAEQMQRDLGVEGVYDLMRKRDPATIRFYVERKVPGWQPKQTLTHHTGTQTLEDLIDQDNAKDAKTIDGGIAENPQQGQRDSALPVQRSSELLLEPKDTAQHDLEAPAEGAE